MPKNPSDGNIRIPLYYFHPLPFYYDYYYSFSIFEHGVNVDRQIESAMISLKVGGRDSVL